MTAKEVAKRIIHHVFAWVLLLGLGIAAILGGIAIVDSGYRSTLVVWPPDGAGTANVVFFLVLLSVVFGLWFIAGVSYGTWTLSPRWVVLTIIYALVLLAFGEVGLGAIFVGQLVLYARARLG
jgi:hypothetical protein